MIDLQRTSEISKRTYRVHSGMTIAGALQRHPDKGGNVNQAAEINDALNQARRYFRVE